MDLDDFDSALVLDDGPLLTQTAKDAVAYIDQEWYTLVNRRGRWMDLIGDYAGSEPFVVDGEALIQFVLDDPLLALGRKDDPSFQSIHAIYTLERVLHNISRRSDAFELVFWHDRRFQSIAYDDNEYVSSSRSLARQVLFNHLKTLDIPLHIFADIEDPAWLTYQRLKKPMFVMTADGGVIRSKSSNAVTERVLLQRVFLYLLLSQGVSVTLLRGAEYKDSKIMSFVYEQRPGADPRSRFKPSFWEAVQSASASLYERELQCRTNVPLAPLALDITLTASVEELLRSAMRLEEMKREPFSSLLYVFVTHLLYTPSLELRERGLPSIQFSGECTTTLVDFLKRMLLLLEGTAVSANLDGRIFSALLQATLSATDSNMDLTQDNDDDDDHYPLSMLPFTHPLFDEELSTIRIDADEARSEDTEDGQLEFNTLYEDTQHWHNHKRAILPAHLGGSDTLPAKDAWQRKKQLRSEQRFMSKLQWQAETLTGAFGTPLQQIVIPSAAASRKSRTNQPAPSIGNIEDPKTAKQSKSTTGKKGKKEVVSSADKIRLANQAKKQAKEDDTNAVWWKEQLRSMDSKSTTAKIAAYDVLTRNKRTKDGWLTAESLLYRIHLEFERWTEDPARETAIVRDRSTVSVMRMVKDLYDCKELFPTVAVKLASCLTALGFADYLDTFESAAKVSSEDRSLHFDFVKLVKSKSGSAVHKWMKIIEPPVVWQLRLFGEFLDRSMDSQPDPRVQFKPDAWQRKVLDCLDRNESVLVAAPTSAGKTFISYYAMEKILRTSDDDILVYVAPTKALVSQIAAEVYARFRKELGSKACWAIHTRDYRVHNPQNCQILVTVPEMLATMLLSPPLARTWTPKIKRIILDEIHTIGQQEGGAVWEQIILLAPCPLIGLSATIGEPEKFNAWLASVQEAHRFKHTFIHHPHRYSHLRKFEYLLQPKHQPEPFPGLPLYRQTERMRFVHPISMLAFGARRLPPDFSLEAADCLSLYRAFEAHKDRLGFDIDQLDPIKFFQDDHGTLLRQKDILRYEAILTKQISELIDSIDPQDQNSSLNAVIKEVSDPVLEKADQRYVPDATQFFRNLIALISDLHAGGDLPAILFNFDRKVCEKMAQALLTVLEEAEGTWREQNPEWKRKIKQWEAWVARAKERERLAERLKKVKKDDDKGSAADSPDASWEASFNPDEPSPQFSFAGSSPAFTKEDLDDEIRSLSRWSSAPEWALNGLRRGIGVHHSGMNKHYRTLVESLYRSGYLRVVIATGTLALGINAPTKTSVFCGDSPFLTALMSVLISMSPTAGRRGFDLLGKVVFYGLPMDRCQRLVLSKLPSLGGNFPLTSTMVLRLFSLLHGSNDAPVACDAIRSILRLPHVSFVSEAGREQILHHIRFTIDYLRRAGLLNAQGSPINLFGVAAHLYYTEPSNLALVALMRHGVLHRVCNQSGLLTAERELMILLSHLFGRRYLPRTYASPSFLKTITHKSPSIVVLPPLPEDARKVLAQHDDHIMRVFVGYATAYVSSHAEALGEDNKLPFSRMALCPTSSQAADTPFLMNIRRIAVKPVARSPFVATSGHSDHFSSVRELTTTARDGLHLNEYAIPSMQQFTATRSASSEEFALNAYLYDFFMHGQTAALRVANGIRDGEMWYVLQDFSLTLKAMRTGLVQLLQKAASEASEAASAAGDEYSELDSGYGTMSAGADPAEADPDLDGSAEGAFKRPPGVSDRDWRVFEVLNALTADFDEKFRAMWA
ncbi:P-loop containing nucleoside triphosphate hydrolase protein [Epithele typhae]|uniref:P-loop containing nucleoside triphosphate hydrolase protein n=1 Tax=Epithele typhae TaxID=378194 RepID=UPI002007D8ED|nr:P-loop containing nucleoside triphosphate hydrolase protein [Epithele typhae]KAH9943357.1 P-loop containing nucleoside triphosphate hydrolase protein [Epithele typhae]